MGECKNLRRSAMAVLCVASVRTATSLLRQTAGQYERIWSVRPADTAAVCNPITGDRHHKYWSGAVQHPPPPIKSHGSLIQTTQHPAQTDQPSTIAHNFWPPLAVAIIWMASIFSATADLYCELYIYFTIYFRQHHIQVLSLPRYVST